MAFQPIEVRIKIPDRQSSLRDQEALQAELKKLFERYGMGPHRKVELKVTREDVRVAYEIPVVALKAAAD